MRQPELNEPQSPEEYPPLLRRILFLGALASIGIAVLAAFMCKDGLADVLGLKSDPYAARDRVVAAFAGIPTAIGGIAAAVCGRAGTPVRAAKIAALLGIILNTAVILGVGIPFLLDYIKSN